MFRHAASLAAIGIVMGAMAGCTAPSASPLPSPSASPSPSPSVSPSPVPSASPDGATYWLRLTTTQAIPPLDLFAVQPPVRITGDGTLVVLAPVPTVYPGPLLPTLLGRSISTAGEARIIAAARELGLLSGRTDFTSPNPMLGGVTGHIELTVDGGRVTLTGDPSTSIECATTPCEPAPGSPEAFGELWRRVSDLPSWLGAELGPESPYAAPAFALVVGPAPQPDPMLTQAPADWPLDQPLATFGGPVANGTARCGTAGGSDADTLRPALAAANQLTPWVQDPGTSATFGLTARPMVPGEDACVETFGDG
jgi:hypothetical protein